jgi:hypothetical protein
MRRTRHEEAPPPRNVEIIRETQVIVKVRCPYCANVYNEILDRCPNCGGHR